MGRKLTWDSDILLTIKVEPLHWRRVRDVMMLIIGYPIFLFIEWCIRWYAKGEKYYKNVAEPFLIRLVLWTIGICILLVVLTVLALGIWAHYAEGVQ